MTDACATYRVQLHKGFTFDDAAEIAEYLAELGISHMYCSPYLQAAPGSMHGYDVVDCRRLNEELGGAPGHERLHAALRRYGLRQILDVVSNHMAIVTPHNPWWWDVLENGPSSTYASYFDVDWDTPERRLRNSVLLPVLGDQYGFILDRGEIRLERDNAQLIIRYYDNRFPVAPRSLDSILGPAAKRCGSEELAFIADALGELPLATATDRKNVTRRHRDKSVLLASLERLIDSRAEVAQAIDAVITEINHDRQALHVLLERQNYRLAYWRAALRDLGYRRFFDINTLAGLRMEDYGVFEDTHFLILRLLKDGVLDGLRIDHIDGLRAPEQYLRRLVDQAPKAWLLVEKILMPGERLRDSWPISGTTGYDFIRRVGGLFVDPAGETAMSELFSSFTGESIDYEELAVRKKNYIMSEVLGSDLSRLTALFVEICELHPHHRDYTRHELHEVLRSIAAHFPVYRTYRSCENDEIHPDDQKWVEEAVQKAKKASPQLDSRLFEFAADILLLRIRGDLEDELAMCFQQFTGPVMAKSIEDTVFYCFNRLICLNEVGCDPSRFGISIEEFHEENRFAQQRWPEAMLTTSTHDTKRGEDMRARISLLSEIPVQWSRTVRRWAEINQACWGDAERDANAEYLLYQTLVGAWPIEIERVSDYMLKAVREAKVHTSWTSPNKAYEQGLAGFIQGIFASSEFMNALQAFTEPLVQPGRLNSLAQTLLKITAPGIPDFYQGSELWNFALVDPDNRRLVDYDLRKRLLKEMRAAGLKEILARTDDGMPKLWVIHKSLALRARHPEWFGREGTYEAIGARGSAANHIVAFMRSSGAITVVPRFPLKLGGRWKDTAIGLPDGSWQNEFTGELVGGGDILVADLLAKFPVCLLSRAEKQ
jgi:(1->4)-alpha-D-glucan 1-alpha-D-glucosylmutase